MAYAWPGNVRELRNVADRFVLGLLGERLTGARHRRRAGALPRGLPQQVEHFERTVIVEALRRHQRRPAGRQPARSASPGRRCYDKLRQTRHLGGRVQGLTPRPPGASGPVGCHQRSRTSRFTQRSPA